MKKIFASFILFSLVFPIYGKPLAVINSVKGNVFSVLEGKTQKVKDGQFIYDFMEVISEEGSQVTFTDYYDHRFHLAGSGHIKILNKIVELKQGYIWIESYHKDNTFKIQTSNAIVSFVDGQGVISFDNYTGKTQLLSVKGKFEFANSLRSGLGVILSEGQFSFIDNKYESGNPRNPTNVGYSSFQKITSLFNGIVDSREKKIITGMVPPREEKKTISRGIASVNHNIISPKKSSLSTYIKPGKITYLKRTPASLSDGAFDLEEYYSEKLNKIKKTNKRKKFRPSYVKKSSVKLKVFGFKSKRRSYPIARKQQAPRVKLKIKPEEKKRLPSSLIKKPEVKKISRGPASVSLVKPMKVNTPVKPVNDGFEASVLHEYKNQMRHTSEVNDLINELKTYNQDYKPKH